MIWFVFSWCTALEVILHLTKGLGTDVLKKLTIKKKERRRIFLSLEPQPQTYVAHLFHFY